jgi:hypothetical protein
MILNQKPALCSTQLRQHGPLFDEYLVLDVGPHRVMQHIKLSCVICTALERSRTSLLSESNLLPAPAVDILMHSVLLLGFTKDIRTCSYLTLQPTLKRLFKQRHLGLGQDFSPRTGHAASQRTCSEQFLKFQGSHRQLALTASALARLLLVETARHISPVVFM